MSVSPSRSTCPSQCASQASSRSLPAAIGAAYIDVRVGIAEWSMELDSLTELIDAASRSRTDFNVEIQEQRGDFLPGARGG